MWPAAVIHELDETAVVDHEDWHRAAGPSRSSWDLPVQAPKRRKVVTEKKEGDEVAAGSGQPATAKPTARTPELEHLLDWD